MSKRRSSLTGSWSGAYRYPGASGETVFNAQIEESGGAFVGATQEPNDFLDTTDSVLHGEIDGVREGRSVTFTKFYNHGHEGARHSIRYEGAADENLMRVEGRWIVSSNWSGTFFMVRDDEGEAAEAEERAEAMLDTRK
jgi:hypothetical protein